MFSWFRRHRAPSPPTTFNERVAAFWQWYTEVAPRLLATIDAGRCSALTDETSTKVDECFPGFAWVYGPGAGGDGHSFTLTGEGNLHRQLLTQQWLRRAPSLTGWTFYAARQSGPIKGRFIEMDGIRFDPAEIWVTPTVDAERQCVDLTVWHPLWDKITEKQRGTITFLFLDEALGEYGTEWWIGRLQFGRDQLAGSFPLAELASYVNDVVAKEAWKKFPPGQNFVLYKAKGGPGSFPRADVLTQSTAVPRLFIDLMNQEGELADPLAGTGADYVYVSIARSYFTPGSEVADRGKIEDAIDRALEAQLSGRCIGGGLGSDRCYCDFLIFDGARSIEIIQQTLRRLTLPAGTMIEYFAREKRGLRVAL